MFRFEDENLSSGAISVLTLAQREAANLDSESVKLEHVLLALMQNYRDVGQLFEHFGYSHQEFRNALQSKSAGGAPGGSKPEYSEDVITLVRSASRCAKLRHCRLTGTRHLFYALWDGSCNFEPVIGLMTELGYDVNTLRARAHEVVSTTGVTYIRREERESTSRTTVGIRGSWVNSKRGVTSEALVKPLTATNKFSTLFSPRTKAIFRGACIYVRRNPDPQLPSQIELEHIYRAFNDLKESKFQLVLETVGAGSLTEFRKSNILFTLQASSMRGAKFEDVELSDAVSELIQRAMGLTTGVIEPEHLLSVLLSATGEREYNTLVGQVFKVLESDNLDGAYRKYMQAMLSSVRRVCPLSASVYRVLRYSKIFADYEGDGKVSVLHLVPSWCVECHHSEIEFAQRQESDLNALLAYSKKLLNFERLGGSEFRSSKFGNDVYDVLDKALEKAIMAEMDRIDINHFGIGLLDVLAKNRDFAETTGIDFYALISTLQQMIIPRSAPWALHHKAIRLLRGRLDDDIAVSFWGATATPLGDVPKMSRFELLEVLSFRTELVIEFAAREANRRPHCGVRIEDIFVGLLCETLGPNLQLFALFDIDSTGGRKVLAAFDVALSRRQQSTRSDPESVQLLELAWLYARRWRDVLIEPEHLLYAMTKHPRGVRILNALGLAPLEVTSVLRDLMLEERKPTWTKRFHQTRTVPESEQPKVWEQILRMNKL
ncbi:MAG TPA: Clp protease N-terminal domain-containing protein [Oculatellaceae cyanobacterium]